MSGCSRIRVHRHLVAVDDVEHAIGDPGLRQQLGREQTADGSFSDGLRMNVLPQAMALANIHIGHHGREVEGRDPRRHAERLADLVDVDTARAPAR